MQSLPVTVNAPWRNDPRLCHIIDLFTGAGHEICFVGGCVRNAILDLPPADYDFAVSLSRAETIAFLKKSGFEVETVTDETARITVENEQYDFLCYKKAPFPPVSFTSIANEITGTRFDFTINAIWMLPDGRVFSPINAFDDIITGHIRFIGEPSKIVIQYPERILRFFRFAACIGNSTLDKESVAACIRHVALIRHTINRDYYYRQMTRLLGGPKASFVLRIMHDNAILPYFTGFPADCAYVEALRHAESIMGRMASWHVRCVLLILGAKLPAEKALSHLKEFWNMQEADETHLAQLLEYGIAIDASAPPEELDALAAELGKERVKELLWVRWAMEDDVNAGARPYIATFKRLGR